MPLTLEEARALFEEEDEKRRTRPTGVSLEEARNLFGLPPEEPPSRLSQATEAVRAAVSPEPFQRPAEVSPQALGLEIPSPAATSRTIPPALPPEPAVAPPPPPPVERVMAGERPAMPVAEGTVGPVAEGMVGPPAAPPARPAPSAPLEREVEALVATATPPQAAVPAAARRAPAPEPLVALAEQATQRYGLPPGLLVAMMRTENDLFDPNAVGSAGEIGLLQIKPTTARLSPEALRDPATNVDAGARLMRQYLERSRGDVGKALVAWNAGPGAVEAAERQAATAGGAWTEYLRAPRALTYASVVLGFAQEGRPEGPVPPRPRPPAWRPGQPPEGMQSAIEAARQRAEEAGPPRQGPSRGERWARGHAAGVTGSAAALLQGIELYTGIPTARASHPLREFARQAAVQNPTLLDEFYQALGSASSLILPGIGVAGLTVKIATVAPRVARWVGVTANVATEALAEAGEVYERVLAKTGDEEQARTAANQTAGANVLLLFLTNRFGPFLARGGWWSRVLQSAGSNLTEEAVQNVIGDMAAGEPVSLRNAARAGLMGAVIGSGFGAVSPGRGPTAPAGTVPEATATLRQQWRAFVRGDKPAIQIPAESMPDALPQSSRRVWLPDGTAVVYDPVQIRPMAPDAGRAARLDDWITQEFAAGRGGQILGYGVAAKPPAGTETLVETRGPRGEEVQTVVAPTPPPVETMASAERMVPPEGGAVRVTPPPAAETRALQVIEERLDRIERETGARRERLQEIARLSQEALGETERVAPAPPPAPAQAPEPALPARPIEAVAPPPRPTAPRPPEAVAGPEGVVPRETLPSRPVSGEAEARMVGPAEAEITLRRPEPPPPPKAPAPEIGPETIQEELRRMRMAIDVGQPGRRLFDERGETVIGVQRSTYPDYMTEIAPTRREALQAIEAALSGRATGRAQRALEVARRRAGEPIPGPATAPPRTGEYVETPQGPGQVLQLDLGAERAQIRLDTDETIWLSLGDLTPDPAMDFLRDIEAQAGKPAHELTAEEIDRLERDVRETRAPYFERTPEGEQARIPGTERLEGTLFEPRRQYGRGRIEQRVLEIVRRSESATMADILQRSGYRAGTKEQLDVRNVVVRLAEQGRLTRESDPDGTPRYTLAAVPPERGPGAQEPTPSVPPEPAGGMDEAALRAALGPGDRSRLPSDVPAIRAEGTLAGYTDDRSFRDWLGSGSRFWNLKVYRDAKAGRAIPIYRAVPTQVTEIHPGAYVTQSRAYAQEHLDRVLRGDGHILSGAARADDLHPVNPNEFWYVPAPAERPSPPGSPSVGEPRAPLDQPTPEQLELTYARRPDAGPEADRLAHAVLDDLTQGRPLRTLAGGVDRPTPGALRGRPSGAGSRTLALGLPAELARTGRVELRGRSVRFADDLADLGQLYRDPRVETLHTVYVRGDQVLASEGITSRLPGASDVFTTDWQTGADRMRDRMRRLGADGYWLLHNHPSGVPRPSPGDATQTRRLAQAVPGFRGHVVIDFETYGLIEPDGLVSEHPLPRPPVGPDPLHAVSLPGTGLGVRVTDADALARVGAARQQPGYVVLVYTSGPLSRVQAIQETPRALFLRQREMTDHVRGRARAFGGTMIFSYSGEADAEVQQAAARLIEAGILRDHVERNVSYAMPETRWWAVADPGFGRPMRGVRVEEPTAPYSRGRRAHLRLIRGMLRSGQMTFEDAERRGHLKSYPELRDLVQALQAQPPTEGRVGATNLDYLDTTEDLKALLSATYAAKAPEIDRARKVPTPHAETRRRADELIALGLDERAIQEQVARGVLDSAQITAARDLVVASNARLGQTVEAALEDLDAGREISEQTVRRFSEQYVHHVAFLGTVQGQTSEIARALNAHKIIATAARQPAARQRAGDAAVAATGRGDLESARGLLTEYARIPATDHAARNRFLQESQNPKWWEYLIELRTASLLWGPPTHIVNTLDNLAFGAYRIAERATAAGVEEVLSLGGLRRPKQVFWREAPAEVVGWYSALGSGRALARLAAAWQTEGATEQRGAVAVNVPARGTIPGRVGEIVRTPFAALAALDAGAKQIGNEASLHASAHRISAREGLGGEAYAARVADLLQSPTPGMLIRARAEENYRTLTDELGTLGREVMRIRNRKDVWGFLGRWMAPFVTTGVNGAKRALERTPLGFAMVAHRAAQGRYRAPEPALFAAGDVPETLAEDLAKPILGSLAMIAFGMLTAAGVITGGGPTDWRKRQMWEAGGWQAYSIWLGPKLGYVSYERTFVLGSMLGMAADIATYLERGEEVSPSLTRALYSALVRNITDKTVWTGLLGLAELIYSPERAVERWIEQQAGSAVPFGGMTGALARAKDPYRREIHGAWDAIRARVPFLRETLPKAVGVLEEEAQSMETAGERLLSPYRRRMPEPERWVERELAELGVGAPQVGRMLTPATGEKEARLEPEEYREYLRTARRLARVRLGDLLREDWYRDLPREEKVDAIEKEVGLARTEARRAVKERLRERVGVGR